MKGEDVARIIPEAEVIARFGMILAISPERYACMLEEFAREFGTPFESTAAYVRAVLEKLDPHEG